MVIKREFAQDPLAFCGQLEQYLPAVIAVALSLNVATLCKPVGKFNGAVRFDLQPLGEHANSWDLVFWQSLNGQQELMLPRFDARFSRCILAESHKAPDLITQFRKQSVVRDYELPHQRKFVATSNYKYIVIRYICVYKDEDQSREVVERASRGDMPARRG
jgi:hypothetical protein